MADTCPVPTPDHRMFSEILDRAERLMMDRVHGAVAEAAAQVREQVLAAGLDIAPTPEGFFQSLVHQRMYLALCGTKDGSFEGGNVAVAIAVIRSQQGIANRYWGADIAMTPKAQ